MNASPDKPKDIFISYNRADEAWAQTLAERIEAEAIDEPNGRRQLTVFFAPWDIEVGTNFVNALADGLRKARFFSPIMTPEFFSSGWTNFEWTDQVALDPTNASGRILPILLRNASLDNRSRLSIPPPFNVLNRLDFREQKNFESRLDELLRVLRGQPKARGSLSISRQPKLFERSSPSNDSDRSSPSDNDELLLTNLVAIDSEPELIWTGNTSVRKRKEVWEKVVTNEAFILTDKKLMAFCNVADDKCTLHPVIDSGSADPPITRKTLCSTEEGQRRYVELLNDCLVRHLRERKIGRDEDGRFYFWPARDSDGVSTTRHHAFAKEREREVAARKSRPDTGETFWVHYAASIRFEILGSVTFLRIEPTYVFTKDGKKGLEAKAVGKLAIQWTGKQQNPDLLRSVLFWVRFLADGQSEIRIPAGASYIRARASLAAASAHFGVVGDYIRIQAIMQETEPSLDDVVEELEIAEADSTELANDLDGRIEE
jgi:hypothetical protein